MFSKVTNPIFSFSFDSLFSERPFGGDGNWHKIGISFQKDKIVAYLDCEYVNELELKSKMKIKTDGSIKIGGSFPEGDAAFKVSSCKHRL